MPKAVLKLNCSKDFFFHTTYALDCEHSSLCMVSWQNLLHFVSMEMQLSNDRILKIDLWMSSTCARWRIEVSGLWTTLSQTAMRLFLNNQYELISFVLHQWQKQYFRIFLLFFPLQTLFLLYIATKCHHFDSNVSTISFSAPCLLTPNCLLSICHCYRSIES